MSDRKKNLNVTLVGAGNAAWHLVTAFHRSHIRIEMIINRTLVKAKELARLAGAKASSDFDFTGGQSSVIILAVNDSALPDLASFFKFPEQKIVVHTSGSIDMNIFQDHAAQYGVLYPFQTLTKGVEVNYSEMPFFIEGNSGKVINELSTLASTISSTVVKMSSENRRKFHLAGAMANNFTNHLIALTFDYLKNNELDQQLILPLIRETVRKLELIPPREGQTGPARRNNREILEKHLTMLAEYPELKDLYKLISDSILAYYSQQ